MSLRVLDLKRKYREAELSGTLDLGLSCFEAVDICPALFFQFLKKLLYLHCTGASLQLTKSLKNDVPLKTSWVSVDREESLKSPPMSDKPALRCDIFPEIQNQAAKKPAVWVGLPHICEHRRVESAFLQSFGPVKKTTKNLKFSVSGGKKKKKKKDREKEL
uniref:uncharacterized protein LOC143310678 n=1 Tax=Arvicanthis niloticus TaxID=61156 RepID=UPI00402B33BC